MYDAVYCSESILVALHLVNIYQAKLLHISDDCALHFHVYENH
jgi:hypothetical protein